MKINHTNKNRTKVTINVADKVTDIVTDGTIVVLALAGTGVAAPALGIWSGLLAGTTGVAIAGFYGLKTVKKTIELFNNKR